MPAEPGFGSYWYRPVKMNELTGTSGSGSIWISFSPMTGDDVGERAVLAFCVFSAAKAAAPLSAPSLRILIIDDDPVILLRPGRRMTGVRDMPANVDYLDKPPKLPELRAALADTLALAGR